MSAYIVLEENFVEEKHICYYTGDSDREIVLYEVVNRKYRHPEALEHAFVWIIETKKIGQYNRLDDRPDLILLEASQKTTLRCTRHDHN